MQAVKFRREKKAGKDYNDEQMSSPHLFFGGWAGMEVQVKNLTKRFDKTTAVDSINVTFQDGKLTGLLGPSGCGKSTTLYMLCLLYTSDAADE